MGPTTRPCNNVGGRFSKGHARAMQLMSIPLRTHRTISTGPTLNQLTAQHRLRPKRERGSTDRVCTPVWAHGAPSTHMCVHNKDLPVKTLHCLDFLWCQSLVTIKRMLQTNTMITRVCAMKKGNPNADRDWKKKLTGGANTNEKRHYNFDNGARKLHKQHES